MTQILSLWLLACTGSGVTIVGDTGGAPGGDSASDTGNGDTDTSADSADTSADTSETGDSGTPGAPSCTISAPASGFLQAYDQPFTFAATATDPEDGNIPGSQMVWTTSASATALGTGTSLSVLLPASGAQTITCTATDSEGNEGRGQIVVTALSPLVEIWHPGEGETRDAGSMIPFIGHGRDLEDGALTGGSLVWTSNLDGPIGTGESFDAALTAGAQVITLTGTDSDGNNASETLALTIK